MTCKCPPTLTMVSLDGGSAGVPEGTYVSCRDSKIRAQASGGIPTCLYQPLVWTWMALPQPRSSSNICEGIQGDSEDAASGVQT